jgi:hypothetical protein
VYFPGVSPSEISCPACSGLDWSRDGIRIRLLPDGSIDCRRIAPSNDVATPWACEVCGHRVVVWAALNARLNGISLPCDGVA